MTYVLILILFVFPVLAAIVRPRAFVYYCLVVGPLPLLLEARVATPFGNLDLLSIRLFGFIIGAGIVAFLHARDSARHAVHYLPHLLFLLYCVASLTWAPSLQYGARTLAKLWAPFLFLLCVRATIRDERTAASVAKVILATSLALVVLGLGAEAAGLSKHPSFEVPGLGPAVFSANLMVAAMVPFAHFVAAGSLVHLGIFAVLFVSIVGAFTRITMAGTVAGAGLILMRGGRGPWRVLAPAAIGVGGLLAVFFVPALKERMFLGGGQKMSLDLLLDDPTKVASGIAGSGRYDLWANLLEKFFTPYPVFGSGVGATQAYLYQGTEGATAVHSEYVRLLCEFGALGAFLSAVFVAFYFTRLLKACRQREGSPARAVSLAALGALLAYVVFCATDNGLDYVAQMAIMVFALIGAADGAREAATQRGPVPAGSEPGVAVPASTPTVIGAGAAAGAAGGARAAAVAARREAVRRAIVPGQR